MKEGVVAMAEGGRDYQRELSAIMNAIADSVAETPPGTLLSECREDGIDVDGAANKTKSIFAEAVKRFKQRKLQQARAEYQARVLSMQKRIDPLPQSIQKKRDLLATVFTKNPQFQAILTAAARDFRELSDDDVDLVLKQLQELGALDDLSSQNSNT